MTQKNHCDALDSVSESWRWSDDSLSSCEFEQKKSLLVSIFGLLWQSLSNLA
jgi:hypothetical protein